jgi:hypothetical protein
MEKQNLYFFSFFSNGFDNNADQNLYGTVVHLMMCKAFLMNMYSFSCYEKIFKIIVVLQNCINLL